MAPDSKFHHPIPLGLLFLLVAASMALAFGARALALPLFGLPCPGWLAAALGAVIGAGVIELVTRALRRTR
jgi:hypothetical protein